MSDSLTKRERRIISLLLMLWVILLTLFVPERAYAYIDPATTTYLIQIATALIITLGVSFTIVLYRFRMLFTKLWVKLSSPRKRGISKRTETDTRTNDMKEHDLTYRAPDFVIEGSLESPDKAYGFAYEDGERLSELYQAYVSIRKQQLDEGKVVQMVSAMASSRNEDTLKGRWAELLADTRSFKVRLGLSVLVSASLVFTVMIFGPLEIFTASRNEMLFDLKDFLMPLLLVSGGVFLLITAFLVFLRGRLFNIFLSICAGLLLATYVQALFFNGMLGTLTGDLVNWQDYSVIALSNLLVWLAIVAGFFVINFINIKAWHFFTVFISSVIIVVQLVGLFSISDALTRERPSNERDLVLTNEGIMELSKQKNIVVFIVDLLDGSFIDEVRVLEPDFFEELVNFTEYDDNTTRYVRTFPSVAYTLTGQRIEENLNTSQEEFFIQAYNQPLFVDDLVSAGWNTKLYLSEGYDFSSKALLQGRASNLVDMAKRKSYEGDTQDIQATLNLIKRLVKLSLYRYAPIGFKAVFWMSSSEVSQLFFEDIAFTSDYQVIFMEELKTTGLTADIDEPVFIYLHLNGPHGPHILGVDGYPADAVTDPVTETQGCFNIIYEYIRQLKDLGIYEETCIIITGDHSNSQGQTAGLFYKPFGDEGRSLQLNSAPTSDTNLVPTVLDQAGVRSNALAAQGYPYPLVTTENTPVRWSIAVQVDDIAGPFDIRISKISGKVRDSESWQLIKDLGEELDLTIFD